jgi:hypothetical protein
MFSMGYRYREKILRACSAGKYEIWWPAVFPSAPIQTNIGYAGITRLKTSDDYTQPPPYVVPNPLVLVDYDASPGMIVDGSISDGAFLYRYDFYTFQNRTGYQYCLPPTSVDWQYWATKALANLNPSAPTVDLPLFLFEFKDFPRMLKNLGDVLLGGNPRAIPEGYLAYSFGWKPLFSDLMGLLNLQKSIEDRMRYLRNLEEGTHMRRSLGSGVVQHVVTPNGFHAGFTAWTGSPILIADVTVVEKQKVWFTANAKLVTPLPAATVLDNYVRTDVLRALGLTGSFSTLWNAIPWSWLIDYFLNIGDFLEAQRGWIQLSVPQMCIMCRSEVTSTLTNVRNPHNLTVWGGSLKTTAKQRHVVYEPIPWLRPDPFLSGSQILNLGALGVAATLRSKGFGGAR